MTDRQVFVFGSFTEDEVRSLQYEPPKNDGAITFGSLDPETLRSVGIFNTHALDLHLPKGSEILKSSGPLCGFTLPCINEDSKAICAGENGCIGSTSVSDIVVRELRPDHIKRSSSVISSGGCAFLKNSTVEQPGNHIVGGSSSSSEYVGSDDSSNNIHLVASDKSIFNESNGESVAHLNFLPRGLVNSGNLCFLNATLQALLACSPFLELLHELKVHDIPEIGFPTLRAFAEFVSNFDTDSLCKRDEKSALEIGRQFKPIMFESVLKTFTPDIPNNLAGRPRQEDAQEFLSFVMHQMHDELLKLYGQVQNVNGKNSSLVLSTDDENEDDWETVGPRKKTAITRTQSFMPSKLSAIFGGQLRSVVKAIGNEESATIQPFLLLHLNICPEPVHTIEDALGLFSAPETLEGYRPSASRKAEVVTASKSVKILELSEIMVLHLMRFSYETQGSTKLHKSVHFPLELVIGSDLISSPSSEGRSYELVASITHHGRDPWKGHYTADARHPSGQWLRYDDASITPIPECKVLHDQAYVLFYKQL